MVSERVSFRIRFAQALRAAVSRWLGMVLAGCLVLPAWGTSSPVGPTVSAWVTSPYLLLALNIEPADVGKYPYIFSGAVSWPEHGVLYPQGADVYFGVLLPGGTSVRSWAPVNGVITQVPGFTPFARGISNSALFQPFADSNARKPISHIFDGTEPKGLYFVFLILVRPGADPNDSRQWGQVATQPFVVK